MSLPDLLYPWNQEHPATGERMTLRDGIHWVRMPLPFALNHINLWMLNDCLDGQDGWTLVDSGVSTEDIRTAWRSVWAQHSQGQPLHRMLVTHMHPDHVGNAQWLIDQFSDSAQPARLWMSATDHLAALLSSKETTGYGGSAATQFFKAHGLQDPESLAKIEQRSGYYASMVPDVPRAYRRLMHGMSVDIGTRQWQCIAGYGHSPEHISLFDAKDHVLISGDMLLPRISTNVSVTSVEPEGDALGLFLASIQELTELPKDTLCLPSHGFPFTGLHQRVAELQSHHEERLTDIVNACKLTPQTAASLLPVLFKRDLDLHQTTFAMGEAVAHLNYLWHRGQLQRVKSPDGTWLFHT